MKLFLRKTDKLKIAIRTSNKHFLQTRLFVIKLPPGLKVHPKLSWRNLQMGFYLIPGTDPSLHSSSGTLLELVFDLKDKEHLKSVYGVTHVVLKIWKWYSECLNFPYFRGVIFSYERNMTQTRQKLLFSLYIQVYQKLKANLFG